MSEKLPVKVNVEIKDGTVRSVVDAAIDIFSMPSEALGWLGDGVRVHRARSAIKCFVRTKRIADEAGLRLIAPPVKFLAPYIEHCSLEDEDDDDFIEWWSRLLVSASSNYNPNHAFFTNVLKQVSGIELELLEVLARNGRVDGAGIRRPNMMYQLEDAQLEREMRSYDANIVLSRLAEDQAIEKSFDSILKVHEYPGSLVLLATAFAEDGDWARWHPDFKEFELPSWQILESLQLVAMEHLVRKVNDVEYVYRKCAFTDLGAQFYFACHDENLRSQPIDSVPFVRKHTSEMQGPTS